MFRVKKDDNFVTVTLKLEKRVYAREPKLLYKTSDAYLEAKKIYFNIEFSEVPEEHTVVTNMKEPCSGQWRFAIIKPKQESEVVEETKSLTSRTKRGKMEETKEVATDTE